MSDRKILTDYWPKPIPLRRFDWTAVFDDYDGADDSRCPVGFGATREEAIADLLEQVDD